MRRLLVHCHQDAYDVYIGRGKCPKTGDVSLLGNRASHLKQSLAEVHVRTVKDAVDWFENWLRAQVLINAKIRDLVKSLYDPEKKQFKVLGCWCRKRATPKALCHGIPILLVSAELNGVKLNAEDI